MISGRAPATAGVHATRRLTVLHLIKGLGTGGAERLVWAAAARGDHSRFSYEVAYVNPTAASMVAAIEETGVRVHCLHANRSVELGWVRRLHALLRERRYDVVHMHSPFVAGVTRAVARAGVEPRPVLVSTEHCTWSSYYVGTKILNALLYRWDDARFASSRQVYRSIWPGWRTGVEIVMQGPVCSETKPVDDAERSATRRELGLGPDEVVVATVANFRGQKGYPDLLAAARQVLDRSPIARFVAVGYGPLERDIMARHRELALGERFAFLGYRQDVTAVLGAADIFVVASLYEGGPLAVMEAMACGLPVVATEVGFVPDIVADGVHGRVVPVRRPDLLAERILGLVQDASVRTRMSAAARDWAQTFDGSVAIRRAEQVYADLVNPGRAR